MIQANECLNFLSKVGGFYQKKLDCALQTESFWKINDVKTNQKCIKFPSIKDLRSLPLESEGCLNWNSLCYFME